MKRYLFLLRPIIHCRYSIKGDKDREIGLQGQAEAISIKMTLKPKVVATKPEKKEIKAIVLSRKK